MTLGFPVRVILVEVSPPLEDSEESPETEPLIVHAVNTAETSNNEIELPNFLRFFMYSLSGIFDYFLTEKMRRSFLRQSHFRSLAEAHFFLEVIR
ncbi:MAG: hypothetical protein COT73_08115 [Bdellovibrio sp. CG10_big_fil_rev_8_21_14_0_10_47_8]|nr:MAG: hypothetical protein COT73_08115 [Bdellovibrio sp. CG10_big_fil_rev_8_21_14_0_10_47_8]